jgi:hypothetical protein
LGFLRLTKDGQWSTDLDGVFIELTHERFCLPRLTAVSGTEDALRKAFVDSTLKVSMHAANKADADAKFANVTPDRPPGPDAKAKKVASD